MSCEFHFDCGYVNDVHVMQLLLGVFKIRENYKLTYAEKIVNRSSQRDMPKILYIYPFKKSLIDGYLFFQLSADQLS